MDYYAGIDVSLELSSVCILDGSGQIVREAKVASEPEAVATLLTGLGLPLTRVRLEAGPLSQWLHAGLHKVGFDVVEAACRKLKVEHRTTRPYTPRTNGMVERFNGRVQREVLGITIHSHADLETLLKGFNRAYNARRQRVLKDRADLNLDGDVGAQHRLVDQTRRIGLQAHHLVQALIAGSVDVRLVAPLGLLDDLEDRPDGRGDRGNVGGERDDDPDADEVGDL